MIAVHLPQTVPCSSILSLSDTRKKSSIKVVHKQLKISSNTSEKEVSKNPYAWNTRIRARVEDNKPQEALLLYISMVKESVPPDEFTFPSVMKACSALMSIEEGRQIHTQIFKSGTLIAQDVVVQNSLSYMYANCGFVDIARRVFDEMPERNLVSWNSMMAGYSKSTGFEMEAILIYVLMLKGKIAPDSFSFTVLLTSCGSALAVKEALQIHSHVIKLGFESEKLIRNGLIDMYVKLGLVNAALVVFNGSTEREVLSYNALLSGFMRTGDVASAEALFNKMDVKNLVSWNTMVSGYVQHGFYNEALDFCRRMQLEGKNPNSKTIVNVLSACSLAGSLSLGEWIHAYIESEGFVVANTMVKTALVNMYAKCGDIESAHRMFESMEKKDVVAWNVMIEGFALHSRGKDAVELFHNMRKVGVQPDHITFFGLLNACRHSGLVHEGLRVFKSMSIDFGIEPNLQHFACVVDLLGQTGRLKEALEFIEEMPIAPDAVVWGELLGACRIHNDLNLAEYVVEQIMKLDPACSSNYVVLSNIYAARKKRGGVTRMRKMMKTKVAEQEPGCSLIEIGGEVTKFFSGDYSHNQCTEIFQKLKKLMKQIKLIGYAPDADSVFHNMELQEKEKALYFHSEKLAVAFGIINTSPGTVIRIAKNLRICMDCHSAIKLIAQVEKREIVIRDRNRFHHFKDGKCSCGSFW